MLITSNLDAPLCEDHDQLKVFGEMLDHDFKWDISQTLQFGPEKEKKTTNVGDYIKTVMETIHV